MEQHEEVEQIEVNWRVSTKFSAKQAIGRLFLHFLAIEGPTPPWELTRKANILSLGARFSSI